MSLSETLTDLSRAVCIGPLHGAADAVREILATSCEVTDLAGASFCGRMDKGAEKTLLLEAHIDQVGFVVTAVEPSGFVRVAPVGGIDPRLLPATRVILHGQRELPAVFCTTPPHLSKEESTAQAVADLWLDTALGETAASVVTPGDFATFAADPVWLSEKRLCGRSLDDRAGCAVLLELAQRLADTPLPVNLLFLFSDAEELGERGAKTAGFSLTYDAALSLDVSFGRMPGVGANESGVLGCGPMIGYAPVLTESISKRLAALAKEHGIASQKEIMGGATCTDADAFGLAKSGCPVGLLSVPLRNMHTAGEVVDIDDCAATVDLLECFVKEGISCVG